MGCGKSSGASAPSSSQSSAARGAPPLRPDPEAKAIALKEGDASVQVGLVSASLAYCMLVAHAEDSTVFLDAQPRGAYDKGHLHGAWCLADAAASTAPAPSPDGRAGPPAWEAALRTRCSLRAVVVYGKNGKALSDEGVLEILRALQRVGARPKGAPMVLREGMSKFIERFPFCLRKRGEEKANPLPSSPAEVLAPGWAEAAGHKPRTKLPALYLGSDRCLSGGGAGGASAEDAVLRSLGIKQVVGILAGSSSLALPAGAQRSLTTVKATPPEEASGSAGTDVAAARKASEKIAKLTSACLVLGHASALAVALFLVDALPGTAGSVDEVIAYVRQRFPSAEFDASAHSAIAELLVKRGRMASQPAEPSAPEPATARGPSPPPPQPTAAAPRNPGNSNGGAVPASAGGRGAAKGSSEPNHISALCAQMRKRDPVAAEVGLETLRRAIDHILKEPSELKYRRLKASNARVQKEVLAHAEVVEMLRTVGFVRDEQGDLVLPRTTPLQGLRDLLGLLPPPRADSSGASRAPRSGSTSRPSK